MVRIGYGSRPCDSSRAAPFGDWSVLLSGWAFPTWSEAQEGKRHMMTQPHPNGPVTWVIERGIFGAEPDLALERMVSVAGHRVLPWNDSYWDDGIPRIEGPSVFRGSLGNAARLRAEAPWSPGSFCAADRFRCSAWYGEAQRWRLNQQWEVMPACRLVEDPPAYDPIFIRPDGPLKDFAGRLLRRTEVSWSAIDYGYYFEDRDLPVLCAPARQVEREWRYVVVNRRVVAGSSYEATSRRATGLSYRGRPWTFAQEVARELTPPDAAYVMDVCEADGRLWLLELNPFSGADLYRCNLAAVVEEVSRIAQLGPC